MGTDRDRDQNEAPEKVRPFLTKNASAFGLTEDDLVKFWERWERLRKDYSQAESMARLPGGAPVNVLAFLAASYLDRLTVERAVSAIGEKLGHE